MTTGVAENIAASAITRIPSTPEVEFRETVYWVLWASAARLLRHYGLNDESWRCLSVRLTKTAVCFDIDRGAARQYGLPAVPESNAATSSHRRRPRVVWQACRAAAFAHYARHVGDPSTMRAVDRYGVNLIRWFAVERATSRRATDAGSQRAAQRRNEADYHRTQYRRLKRGNPAMSKDTAAELIASDCTKDGRRCRKATVYDHLRRAPAEW